LNLAGAETGEMGLGGNSYACRVGKHGKHAPLVRAALVDV